MELNMVFSFPPIRRLKIKMYLQYIYYNIRETY